MDTKLFSALFLLVCLLGIGTYVYHEYEGWSMADSFYMSVMVITTIGFSSQFSPTTEATRVFTALFALGGISIALYALSVVNKPTIKTLEKIPEKLHPHIFKNNSKKKIIIK